MEVTDLHICEPSMNAESNSSFSECNCPPEYYCTYVCTEGYSLSTVISWQHFPRSTSSPSHCDVSSETRKSLSSTPISSLEEEEQESTKISSTEYPITKSTSQLNAQHYLEIRHVFDLLNFMIGHLVCNEPDDPVQFLVDLLGKCAKYRDAFGEPPLLFTHAHVKSLYTAFDPFERGYISIDQYREAMKSLGLANGITPYNQEPPVNDDGDVEEENFVFEAERCIIENLKKMLRIPKIWEENRLIWKKKMSKKKARTYLKGSEAEFKVYYKRNNETNEKLCNCSERGDAGKTKDNIICHCSFHAKMNYEPEQLFLDTGTLI